MLHTPVEIIAVSLKCHTMNGKNWHKRWEEKRKKSGKEWIEEKCILKQISNKRKVICIINDMNTIQIRMKRISEQHE